MKNRKVLILYAPLGVGHGSAAKAVVEAFTLKYPDIEVKTANVLDFVPDIFKHGLPWAYIQTTLKMPILYRWIYNYYHSRYKSLDNMSGVLLKKSKFAKFIKDFNPDFIVSTNPLSMQLVSATKEKNIINILSANVCTDFGFHLFWCNADVNYYFVADKEVKNSLIEHGINPDNIKITGIPISSKFTKILDRKKIISKLGFAASEPILLIVGGNASYNKLLTIVSAVKEKNDRLQFIIVAGRDEKLYKKLKNSEIVKNPRIKIFDFIDNLEEYMTVADLILTKAGGLTVSECLAKNLPMVINGIIPGQEEDNVKYAVENGFGIKTNNTKEAAEAINKLFLERGRIETMKENCKKTAKPNAAMDLVDFVVSKINAGEPKINF